jgi:hypothetical protein
MITRPATGTMFFYSRSRVIPVTVIPFRIFNVDRRWVVGSFLDDRIRIPLSITTAYAMDEELNTKQVNITDLECFDIQTRTGIKESAYLPWFIRSGDVILYLQ